MDIMLTKPIKLELNNSGSWKTLARFDADDREACDKALTAGMLIGALEPRSRFRIATADGLDSVLMRWSAEKGWRDEFAVPLQIGGVRDRAIPDFEAAR